MMEAVLLDIEKASTILKLVGDKTRLTMLACLTEQEYCVCNFVDMFELSQPAISQHLKKLKTMGIINETKRAQWVYYSLNTESEYYSFIKDIIRHVSIEESCCSLEETCGT